MTKAFEGQAEPATEGDVCKTAPLPATVTFSGFLVHWVIGMALLLALSMAGSYRMSESVVGAFPVDAPGLVGWTLSLVAVGVLPGVGSFLIARWIRQ